MCLGSSLARNLGTLDGEFGAFERLLRIDCSPTVDWLIDELDLTAEESLLDCGAGVGGPAAYAAQAVGVTPLLVEPEAGGCRAARTLFGFPGCRRSDPRCRWLMPPSTPPGRWACCARPPTSSSCSRNCAERCGHRDASRCSRSWHASRCPMNSPRATTSVSRPTYPVGQRCRSPDPRMAKHRRRAGHSAGLDSPRRRGHRRPGRAARHVADVAVGRTPKQADR